MLIKITEDELSSRGNKFNNLLAPILYKPDCGGPGWNNKYIQGSFIIFATDRQSYLNDHRNSRFSTFHKDFKGNYFEIWKKSNKYWYLNKAYFHVFYLDRINHADVEFIGLHSDPTNNNIYKKSPHIHIMKAENPIPKAHISISCGFSSDVLRSEENLFKNIKCGLEMIRLEILESYIDNK